MHFIILLIVVATSVSVMVITTRDAARGTSAFIRATILHVLTAVALYGRFDALGLAFAIGGALVAYMRLRKPARPVPQLVPALQQPEPVRFALLQGGRSEIAQ